MSPAEERFQAYRNQVDACFGQFASMYPIKDGSRLWGKGRGPIYVAGQSVEHPKTGEPFMIEVAIGHDEKWMPIVTVASSDKDPVIIVGHDLARVRNEVETCYREIEE